MSAHRPLHVLQVTGDPVGGVRRHVHTLIRGLDPAQFRVSYAYSAAAVDAGFRNDRDWLARRLHAELPLDIRKKPHPADIANIWRLRDFIRREQVDVVHGHGAKGGLYARVAGRLGGARTVYTPHGGAAHDMFGFPESVIYRVVERLLVPCTDHFLFESRYTADALQKKTGTLPGGWSVNPNGIEVVAVTPGDVARLPLPDAGRVRFGVFGMLREQKGQRFALEAIVPLLRQGRQVSLHFFGDGPDRASLLRMAAEAGVQDAVFFHGDVSPVEPWLAAMDAVVVPSLFESFGYVAVEALLQRRPVIASATGGLTEILDGGAGRLVPPGDASALGAVMSDFLRDPAPFRAAAQQGAIRAAAQYSAAAMVAGAAAVYRRLVDVTDSRNTVSHEA